MISKFLESTVFTCVVVACIIISYLLAVQFLVPKKVAGPNIEQLSAKIISIESELKLIKDKPLRFFDNLTDGLRTDHTFKVLNIEFHVDNHTGIGAWKIEGEVYEK